MKRKNLWWYGTVCILLAACGENGSAGKNALVSITDVPAGELCAGGGVKIESGLDENRNGTLDPEEVTTWKVICRGLDGSDAACTVTEKGSGIVVISCPDGTSAIIRDGKDGADGEGCTVTDNHDGTHTITCGSVEVVVSDGADGENGHNSIIVIEDAPGGTCPNSGQKVTVGVDMNDNGVLDAEEVTATKYVCNGANGHDSLMTVDTVAPGTECPAGGYEIRSGVDTDDDGMLNAAEVVSDVFVCNGEGGAAGHHAVTEIIPVAPGAECPAGGYRFRMGVDENGNGILDEGEYDEALVCKGEKGDPGKDGVCAGNNPPVITSITLAPPDGIGGTYKINVPYSLVVAASDTDDDALAYKVIGGYASIELGSAPGTFTITLRAEGGPFSFAVIVSDGCQVTMGDFVIEAVSSDPSAPWFSDPNLYFSDLTGSGFRVSWNPAWDNWTDPEDLEYKVVYAFEPDEIDSIEKVEAGAGTVAADWTPNMTTVLITGLEQGVQYWVVVFVRDAYHLVSMYNPGSQVVPDTMAPTTAGTVVINGVRDNGFTVSWAPATDNATPEDLIEYRMVVSPNPAEIDTPQKVSDLMGWQVIVDWETMQLTADVHGLASGIKYYVAVVARDGGGNMTMYQMASAITTGDTMPPEPVTNLYAIGLDGRVIFRWDDPDPADLTLGHVEISWTPETPAEPVIVPIGAIVRAADGLTNGTAYTFSVTVVDYTGNRSSEETITVTPADPGMGYVTTGSSGAATRLYRLDPSKPKLTLIGNTGLTHVTSLAIHPATGTGYLLRSTEWDGVYFGGTYTVDLATAAVTLIGSIGNGVYQNPDAAFAPNGTLYAWTENGNDLITINLATGAGTRVGESGVDSWSTGLAFDNDGTLWVKPGNNLWQINPATGAGTYVADIDWPSTIIPGDPDYGLRNVLDFSPATGVGFSVIRTDATTYLIAFTLDDMVGIPVGDLGVKNVSAVEFQHPYVP